MLKCGALTKNKEDGTTVQPTRTASTSFTVSLTAAGKPSSSRKATKRSMCLTFASMATRGSTSSCCGVSVMNARESGRSWFTLIVQELQRFGHELRVVLEHPAVSGIGVDDEVAIRKTPRQIVRVVARHHAIA